MKYLQIALVLAFLGIGEYVFVEYYPLSHTRRIEKFEKLPIVRSFVMAKNIRDVQKMIEKSDSGFVSIMRMNTSKRWYDAQSWAVDFEAGDLSAMRQMYWFANRALRFRSHRGSGRTAHKSRIGYRGLLPEFLHQ
jgi:hypothetical protein